jgi:hypothetical protein
VRSGALAQQWWRMLVRNEVWRDSRVLRHAHLTLRLLGMAVGLAFAVPVIAQEPAQSEQEQDELVTYEEQVVVTASSPDFRFGCGTFAHPIRRHALICAGSA